MTIETIVQFLDVSPFKWHNIFTAIFCGAIIGLERQLRGKPVGIRTSSLIILGTYLFLTATFTLTGDNVDPSRVIGQIITGIGFLGAGVMLSKDGMVLGVTSAATIWVIASLGVLIATDHETAAIKLSILVVIILYGVDVLEDRIKSLTRGVHSKTSKKQGAADERIESE